MPQNFAKLNIALVHDSFTQSGGAERVMEAFHELFPEAPVFTLVCSREMKKKYLNWDIRTSWLQVFYNFFSRLQWFLPLIPLAISSFDFSKYDIIISSSSAFAKNIRVPKNAMHICYCHTPARFAWLETSEYLKQETPRILRPLVSQLISLYRKWDMRGSGRVNFFVANSREVQERIKNIYKKDSEIIYPFVDTEFWLPVAPPVIARSAADEAILTQKKIAEPSGKNSERRAMTAKQDYFLIAGRLQAHKHNDLIIEIFNELGLPLHVVGTGRQEKYLKSIAKNNIKFLGKISDEELRDEYSAAAAYLYPQLEDFGLMPLEAAACGTATLAYGRGGALETVVPGETGDFFQTYDAKEIENKIRSWKCDNYKQEALISQAQKFSKEKFLENFKNYLQKILAL